jgi:undecaprenyl pyrophosphate phosphatase UppP
METIKRNFLKNPSKKNLLLFIFLWLLGIVLLTLTTTDLFAESFFQKKYAMIYMLMIGSTIATAKRYFNYWKNKNLNSHSPAE